ncbi:MAG: isopentenyl transferase family protein [Arenicella sp.]
MYPKVILLGGAPCTGKTTVSMLIASQLNYACLSTDDLLRAITSISTPESRPNLHFMEGWTTQEYYIHHSVDELVHHTIERFKTFSTAIETVIKSHVSRETPIVIEGWGLWPEEIKNLNLSDVGMVWLVADEILLDKRTRSIKSMYEGASDEQRMIQNYVGRSIWYNSKVIEAVGRLDIPSIKVSDELSAEALSVALLNTLKHTS